jgi:glycosyltransferase involved in cell wall biosynthesis
MADAAMGYAKDGHEVYFVTVEPEKEFFSAKGRETLLQLLQKESNSVKVIKARVGSEFELGTPAYRTFIYKRLLVQLPTGASIILSDDAVVWEAAASLHASYSIIGVLHADENHYYNLAKKYNNQADAFVCVSDRVAKTVAARVPEIEAGRIHIIPCGINLPDIAPNRNTGNLLQLVYLGRVSDYQKRTGDLVSICALLKKNNVPYHFNIIGDGETRVSLEQKFRAAGLQQHVTFWGWLSQKEVARHLSESDILVLTSDFEGMPIAMMEALAAGCGIVGTRVSGIEDYEDHPLAKDCFSVFTVGNIAEAAEKINRVAAVPTGERQESAKKLAQTEFSMRVCLDRYMKVMSGLKKEFAPPPAAINIPPKELLYSKALAAARALKLKMTQ